jgi:hypothetical protein
MSRILHRSFVNGLAVAAFFFLTSTVVARQGTQTSAGKQEVPPNTAQLAPPAQPLPYSHKTHVALGLQCQFCHGNPDPGKLMTFPASSRCMGCHATIATNKPAIRKLAQLAKLPEPIPWVRVYAAKPFVRWNHRPHVTAGMKCETCHGQVAQMDVMTQATVVTSMYACIHCHELQKAKTGCDTCHN